MSTQEIANKIGIIAGKGDLPRLLISSLNQRNIKPYLVALQNITDKETDNGAETFWARIGSAGKIINFFKDNEVNQIVLVGGMKRPSLGTLIPDVQGMKLINKIRKSDKGDSSLFETIIEFIEENGLSVVGVDAVAQELVAHHGSISKTQPSKKQLHDIEKGKHIALEIGRLDIGQAVIIQNGIALGVEGLDGTDALIKRCASLQQDGEGAILVKIKKPNQDRRIDLPSIGKTTIELLHENKMAGVAVDSNNSLIIDKLETVKKANELGVFIFGA